MMQNNFKTIINLKISEIELFLISIVLGFWFLNFEAFIRFRNLYQYLPEVDIPSHIFSGVALGIGFYFVFVLIYKRKSIVFPIILTFLAAVSWEILETIEDVIIPQSIYFLDYFFWDGFFDIIFTTTGSALILLFVYSKNKKSLFKKKIVVCNKNLNTHLHHKC